MNITLTENIETVILRYLQEGIPLVREPFQELAGEIDISEDSLIRTIQDLKTKKIIRQISPIYDTRRLGYESLLVVFKVSPDDIDTVAAIINSHPGVSHNYERNYPFNLWFTLAIPPDSKLGSERTVEVLALRTGTKEYVVLRAKKVFKIGLRLDIEGSGEEREYVQQRDLPRGGYLSEEEKGIIRVTQEDMPVVERPFSVYAERLGIREDIILRKLKDFKERGIMRRFAAVLYHRNAGFLSNGMVVWKIPEDIIDEVGSRIASYRAVSHCYERTTNDVWQYNLFSMIHAKKRDDLERIVEEIQMETGVEDYAILYSTREFKKKRVQYFQEDLYHWEEKVWRNSLNP